MHFKIIFPIVFLMVLNNGVSGFKEFTREDCSQLGFRSDNLYCSSCDSLPTVELDILTDYCLKCCNDDEEDSSIKRHAKAVLEVCTCKFQAYPQIEAFIKDKARGFPNLQIRYVRGLDPIIKLMDKNDVTQEVLAIDKWNTDSIQEFLETHLSKAGRHDYLRTNMV